MFFPGAGDVSENLKVLHRGLGKEKIAIFDQNIKAWWSYATLFVYVFFGYNICTYIHTIMYSEHSLRPVSISTQLSAQWAEPSGGAEPRFELGSAL